MDYYLYIWFMNVRLTQKQKTHVLNSDDVYQIMQQVLLRENKIGQHQEHFWAIGLDNQSKILFIELIALGAVNRVNADPPDVFRMGIYKLAVSLILIHNHPSGTLQPSDADLGLTDRMLKVGKLINIDVVDHLIITPQSYVSFKNEGIMDQLLNSGNYEIISKDEAKYKQWKIETEKALDIAKKMKKKGYDVDTIKELTGLKKWDINKL
jgi:DNA repair protein RadC